MTREEKSEAIRRRAAIIRLLRQIEQERGNSEWELPYNMWGARENRPMIISRGQASDPRAFQLGRFPGSGADASEIWANALMEK